MWSNLLSASIFYLIAIASIIFAILSVTLKNMFHSALALIVMLLGVAAVYIYLDAEFLALVQILIYVGAIMTLVIFAIMLTAEIYNKNIKRHNQQKLVSLVIASSMAGFLIFVLSRFKAHDGISFFEPLTLAMIGKELLTKYVLPFELISIILLAALVGSAAISKPR